MGPFSRRNHVGIPASTNSPENITRNIPTKSPTRFHEEAEKLWLMICKGWAHGWFENPSSDQSLLPPVKNSLFEQEETEGSGREGLARWASAALIHLAYADRIVNDRPW